MHTVPYATDQPVLSYSSSLSYVWKPQMSSMSERSTSACGDRERRVRGRAITAEGCSSANAFTRAMSKSMP